MSPEDEADDYMRRCLETDEEEVTADEAETRRRQDAQAAR